MAQNAQRQSVVAFVIFAIVGLVSLLFLSLRKRSFPDLIVKLLTELGIEQQTAKWWVAVSAFETNGWTSRVLKDSKNLFCIIVPNSRRLQYGEGQTIFDSYADSINGPEGLYLRVLKPFRYPAKVESLNALIDYMKSKGYFQSDIEAYKKGTAMWYAKIYEDK